MAEPAHLAEVSYIAFGTSTPLLSSATPTTFKKIDKWLAIHPVSCLLGLVSVTLLFVFLWLLSPLYYPITSQGGCEGRNQSIVGQGFHEGVYFALSVASTWATLTPISRPCWKLRWITIAFGGLVGGVIFVFVKKIGHAGAPVLVCANAVVAISPCFYAYFHTIMLKVGAREKGHRIGSFWYMCGIVGVNIAMYLWSEFVLSMVSRLGGSPFYAPIMFVTGLLVIKVAVGIPIVRRLRRHAQACTRDGHSDSEAGVILELSYQTLYFVFYRKLFFTVEDPANMAVLQGNAMAIDLISAVAVFASSHATISDTDHTVVFTLPKCLIHQEATKLAIRQLSRFTSFISTVGFASWIRFGYNRCAFPALATNMTDARYRSLITNYFVMLAWEIVFVFALYYVLRKLRVDLWQAMKRLMMEGWFHYAAPPLMGHFISDVYFGLRSRL
eukprot:c16097_g1_i1.p1 GENE.c16097_g1_i1~~c16097_g1_i1.p1  ORF type:complete len:455 (+),score=85.18 c16097_g1_i1:41-1366(+)